MSTETPDTEDVRERIATAAETVGTNWPVHSFVTANPLSGYEDRPFHEAVERASTLRGGRAYPDPETFRAAWERGDVDPDVLRAELDAHGYASDPEAALDRLDGAAGDDARAARDEATARVDRVLASWLAAFCDEGEASWPMPNREAGFYDAFRAVARHDSAIPDAASLADAPDDPAVAVRDALADRPRERWTEICEAHLNALPGWTGLLTYRAERGDEWQDAYPITLVGYLAARLLLVERFDAPLDPLADADAAGDDAADDERASEGASGGDAAVPIEEPWLRAWEASYRSEVVDAVADASAARHASDGGDDGRADAQLVFCIDTRSEVFRRHLEATGDYETHGYAGFFGVPMRYQGYDDEASAAACPPIVDAEHHVHERPADAHADEHAAYDRWTGHLHAGEKVLKAVKSNAATAFSFVESAGSAYGAALAARTLVPERVHDLADALDDRFPSVPDFCAPSVEHDGAHERGLPVGMTHEERVAYAAAAFETMGWDDFARLVVFTGHASETTNNPFEASLDCGACAGNPGGPNARVLAAICNDDAVRDALRERGHEIPDDTVFLAAEHNTTTDEVTLYDGDVPESHERDVERLRADLDRARSGAAAERAESMGVDPETEDAVRDAERRAADWAETRPEWGLAGNASFVIGPRDLTADLDLDGRAFLHSYDWQRDDGGDALDAIFAGPVVVTQWINAQYYCATVDNAAYGSGSKVTQNPVGNVGVYQGNGGDLAAGLPLQSLMAADDDPHHQPLRLSVVVHAPTERVREVLADHEHVRELCEHGWLSLTVVDPTRGHDAYAYAGGFAVDDAATPAAREAREAERDPTEPESEPEARVAVADD